MCATAILIDVGNSIVVSLSVSFPYASLPSPFQSQDPPLFSISPHLTSISVSSQTKSNFLPSPTKLSIDSCSFAYVSFSPSASQIGFSSLIDHIYFILTPTCWRENLRIKRTSIIKSIQKQTSKMYVKKKGKWGIVEDK